MKPTFLIRRFKYYVLGSNAQILIVEFSVGSSGRVLNKILDAKEKIHSNFQIAIRNSIAQPLCIQWCFDFKVYDFFLKRNHKL